MKKTISVLLALCVVSTAVFAQKNKKKNPEGWREKVRAEQVALITQELNLTEAEAQAFWPVYNDVQNQRREAFKACGEAMKTLREAEEGANYNALLDKYLSAKKKAEAVDEQAIARYKSVLPAEKIAKLVLAEEKGTVQAAETFGLPLAGLHFTGSCHLSFQHIPEIHCSALVMKDEGIFAVDEEAPVVQVHGAAAADLVVQDEDFAVVVDGAVFVDADTGLLEGNVVVPRDLVHEGPRPFRQQQSIHR